MFSWRYLWPEKGIKLRGRGACSAFLDLREGCAQQSSTSEARGLESSQSLVSLVFTEGGCGSLRRLSLDFRL